MMQFTPLTEEQRESFEHNGFLLLPDALHPAQVDRLLEVADQLYEKGKTTDGLNDRGFWQQRNCLPHDPALLDLVDCPTTVPLVVQLLGHNIQLITSHLVVRPPIPEGTEPAQMVSGWHRDGGTAPSDLGGALPRMFIKIGYWLTDLSQTGRGAIRLIPGSNNLNSPPLGLDRDAPEGAIELKVKPGTALLFENRTYHAVGPNTSRLTRKSLFFGYGYRWIRPMDYMAMPLELLERCDPVRRQLLGDCTSPMGFQLPDKDEVPLRTWMEQYTEPPKPRREETPGLFSVKTS